MGRRGIAIVGVALTAGLAGYAGLATGLLTRGSADLVGQARSLVRPPAAAADELPAFADCEQLREWYVRAALPKVGPWGLGGPPVIYLHPTAGRVDAARPPAPAGQAVGSSTSGTNVQESGVDESDIAKTDGRILVRMSGRTLVVTDVSGDRPRERSRTPLPGPSVVSAEVLLRGNRVLVVGEEPTPLYGGPIQERGIARPFPLPGTRQTHSRLVSYDLSDPSRPRLIEARTIDGAVLSTREYADGTVRVVLEQGYPTLRFVHPDAQHTGPQAVATNRRIVRGAPIDAWLPSTSTDAGPGRPLLGCPDVRHPLHPSGFGTLSVTTFPFDDPAGLHATAITTSGDLAYSSAHRLYVATADGRSTNVHAFALDGTRTSYVGSGTVPGSLKDRWSLSEYDGHLRVATTTSSGRHDTVLTVLAERGGRLVTTGRVRGLGYGEDLKAVRWFGNLAVLVTFRQTDPLYTLDLSDPARPRVQGVLKAPGFSSYLHPLGGDLLLGLGQDATRQGTTVGAQAATFDLRDPSRVRRLSTLGLGAQGVLASDNDPRAVTYLPAERVLLTSVDSWNAAVTRFVALKVATDGTLTEEGSWPEPVYGGAGARVLPLGGGRVALVDGSVRVVHVGPGA
jgi:hypothetical protein